MVQVATNPRYNHKMLKFYFGEIPEFSVYVSAEKQTLSFLNFDSQIKIYSISLSKFGMGNQVNSFKTPWGMHEICEKIGDDVPIGGIFRGRIYTGENYLQKNFTPKKNLITTRILRLYGLEENINRGENIDSYLRYIYIHGTDKEELIGTGASHGCIQMKNTEIIELFDILPLKTPVYIGL